MAELPTIPLIFPADLEESEAGPHTHPISEIDELVAALLAKMPFPVGGGSSGWVLTRTNAVVGSGATYAWAAPPARGTQVFIGGIDTGTGLPFTTSGYVYGDIFISASPGHTGKLFQFFADEENGDYWAQILRFQTI